MCIKKMFSVAAVAILLAGCEYTQKSEETGANSVINSLLEKQKSDVSKIEVKGIDKGEDVRVKINTDFFNLYDSGSFTSNTLENTREISIVKSAAGKSCNLFDNIDKSNANNYTVECYRNDFINGISKAYPLDSSVYTDTTLIPLLNSEKYSAKIGGQFNSDLNESTLSYTLKENTKKAGLYFKANNSAYAFVVSSSTNGAASETEAQTDIESYIGSRNYVDTVSVSFKYTSKSSTTIEYRVALKQEMSPQAFLNVLSVDFMSSYNSYSTILIPHVVETDTKSSTMLVRVTIAYKKSSNSLYKFDVMSEDALGSGEHFSTDFSID